MVEAAGEAEDEELSGMAEAELGRADEGTLLAMAVGVQGVGLIEVSDEKNRRRLWNSGWPS